MQLKSFIVLLAVIIFCSFPVAAKPPEYFNNDIDQEYRELLSHLNSMLPQTDIPLAYLASFEPFGLLDVRPLNFTNKDKQAFANFNFGVLGSRFLNISKQQLSVLPGIAICKQDGCQSERIDTINAFLKDAEHAIKQININSAIFIVQQTTPDVFRINNTFYSPTTLITYFPSEHAGFVPSNNVEIISNLDDAPNLIALATSTNELREKMGKHGVAAITKINDGSINIIFGGLADNHWGVEINHDGNLPHSGDYNHLGLKYDIVKPISDHRFYYQTN